MNETVVKLPNALPMGIDPWKKGRLGTTAPDQVQSKDIFLGTFGMYVGIDTVDVDFYVRMPRSRVMEFLDADESGNVRLLARRPFNPSLPRLEQFKQIMLEVFVAWSLYQRPVELNQAGFFKQQDWQDLDSRLEAATKPRARSEFDDPHGLLALMDELSLEVVHHGGDSEYFLTKCPAHHMHRIDLRPRTGEWYCGWCPRGGKVKELRKFFEEHHT
jgi:hypothetical protein